MVVRKGLQCAHELVVADPVLLSSRLNECRLVELLDIEVGTALRLLPQPIDGQVVRDGEHPASRGFLASALAPAAEDALQAVLDQIVGHLPVSHQGSRIAAQSGDERLNVQGDICGGCVRHDQSSEDLRRSSDSLACKASQCALSVAAPGRSIALAGIST